MNWLDCLKNLKNKAGSFFSDKTGLTLNAINKLYDYKKWGENNEDLTALNHLINNNDATDDKLSLLHCLYDAIYHQPLKIDIFNKANDTYYKDESFFLEPYLSEGVHVTLSDVYLMLFYKKIDYVVKKKLWKLKNVRKAIKELLEQEDRLKNKAK